MKTPLYTIGIATTKNENTTLENMVSTLEADIQQDYSLGEIETIICLNNYNSDTENIAKYITDKFPYSNIRLIYSETGIVPSQKKIIKNANSKSDFVIFFDSDISILQGSTKGLIDYMEANPETHALSGDQSAFRLRSFGYEVYNIIGLNPQIMTKRKYLTGRNFAIRKDSYCVPDNLSGEDTFLSHQLIYLFGESAVQTTENAGVVYFGPTTLKDYQSKLQRLSLIKGEIFSKYPQLKEVSEFLKKSRVREEISKLSFKEKLQLSLHDKIKMHTLSSIEGLNKSKWITLNSTKNNMLFKS